MINHFEDSRLFISGGAGVIGSALIEHLSNSGAQIFVGDLKPKPLHFPANIHYREGDLNSITKKELFDFAPTHYIHLAATFERSEESYDFWYENYHHNILLSHYLINLLKDCPALKKVVFASSYLIYDPSLYLFESANENPVSLVESSRISPRNLCGTAKLLHERELEFIQQFNSKRLTVNSARIFRSYGKNSRDIISRWIRALINDETIQVYSKEGIFDFIYADDVAKGLLALAQIDKSGVVNLGTGHSRKISDVLDILKNHFPNMRIEEKKSDILYEASQASTEQFQLLTGMQKMCELETAIPLIIAHESFPPDKSIAR